MQITELVTHNLNRIIDVNYYPVETARRSNLRHRPIGIGVQGLADAFILLGMPFDSPEVILQWCHTVLKRKKPHSITVELMAKWASAHPCTDAMHGIHYNKQCSKVCQCYLQAKKLNKEIFETIYYHALRTSSDLAAEEGAYETYEGCPISKVFTACPFPIPMCLMVCLTVLLRQATWESSLLVMNSNTACIFQIAEQILLSVSRVYCSLTCGECSLLISGTGLH